MLNETARLEVSWKILGVLAGARESGFNLEIDARLEV